MTISDLYSTEEFKHRGQEFVQTIFTYLRSFINKDFYPLQEKAVIAQGEIISTTLMYYYLQEQGIPSTLLSALDFMRIDKDYYPTRPRSALSLPKDSFAETLMEKSTT